MLLLPDSFEPTENEMIIGRGRKIQQHPGNLKLRAFVQLRLKEYSESGDKTLKSFIISDVWKQMKVESSCGGFVKKDIDTDKWIVASDCCVRGTIAQTFRDSLSPAYRSSKFSKQRKRWSQKVNTVQGQPLPPMTLLSLHEKVSSQSADSLSRRAMIVTPPPVSSPFAGFGKTADTLARALEIMDEHEELVSYTENPFEPKPIIEEQVEQPLEALSFANFAW